MMVRRSVPVIKSLATRDEPSASAANFAKLVSALPNAMRFRVFHGAAEVSAALFVTPTLISVLT